MNRYTKIKHSSYPESKSTDFSDFILPDAPPSPKQIKTVDTHDPKSTAADEDGNGEVFGVILNRSGSLSSSASRGFKQSTPALDGSSVIKAFSMRRSCSVSERYCRIHDQSVILASPLEGDEDEYYHSAVRARSTRRRRKEGRSRILKACKRFFGLF
ncbi:hypothetical protein NMG60_11032519 [Bertholletia excelsa]